MQLITNTFPLLKVGVERCRNSPKCASKKDIDEWIYDKLINVQYIDNLPNFVSFNESIVYEEKFLGSFPMALGQTRELVYKFRKNVYERKDNWLWASEEKDYFYDIQKLGEYLFNLPKSKVYELPIL